MILYDIICYYNLVLLSIFKTSQYYLVYYTIKY